MRHVIHKGVKLHVDVLTRKTKGNENTMMCQKKTNSIIMCEYVFVNDLGVCIFKFYKDVMRRISFRIFKCFRNRVFDLGT